MGLSRKIEGKVIIAFEAVLSFSSPHPQTSQKKPKAEKKEKTDLAVLTYDIPTCPGEKKGIVETVCSGENREGFVGKLGSLLYPMLRHSASWLSGAAIKCGVRT